MKIGGHFYHKADWCSIPPQKTTLLPYLLFYWAVGLPDGGGVPSFHKTPVTLLFVKSSLPSGLFQNFRH